MKILFIHQNFPGQFGRLAAALARDKKNQVVALAYETNPTPLGVEVRHYSLLRTAAEETHALLKEEEGFILRAEAAAAAALQLKREGFEPDIIMAHPGWGEALFIKDVFPHAKLVVYCEYFYAADGQDLGFDPEQPAPNFATRCRIRMRNNVNLQALTDADAAISPTQWQRSTFPAWAQSKIEVIHDGVDYDALAFKPDAALTFTRGGRQIRLTNQDKVFSYVARGLEPIRGFHMFMRMLPGVLDKSKDAQAVIVGADRLCYGAPPPDGRSWREYMLDEVGSQIDLSRVHFVGNLSRDNYHQLLSVSRAHLYWTAPFVLSWSFLEAAASGVPLIASDTPPVQEFANQVGAGTVPFFDTAAWGDTLLRQLSSHKPRPEAGQILESLEIKKCLKRQHKLLQGL